MKKDIEALTLLIGSSLWVGCAQPCADDGLLQQRCPTTQADGSEGSGTDSASASNSSPSDTSAAEGDSVSDSLSGSPTTEASADSSATEADATDTENDATDTEDEASATENDATDTEAEASATENDATDTDGVGPWCVDADGDGFGDPAACDDDQDPDDVDNDDDCDDTDPDVHPGAASEEDPTLCTADEDGDGFGDANPDPGVDGGTDCWDANPALNPGTMMLATVDRTLLDNVLASVDTDDASLDLVGPFETLLFGWSVTSTALRSDGAMFIADNESDRIYRADADTLCLGELTLIDLDLLPEAHGADAICGLVFLGNGDLYAVDAADNRLHEIDPDTGASLSSIAIEAGGDPLEIGGCGVAWDCAGDRLLLANGIDGVVYEIDVGTGDATVLAETGITAAAIGLEHDVASGHAWLSANGALRDVAIDGSNEVNLVGDLDYGLLSGDIIVDDLASIPACDP